ncbi:MAG: TAT-variant-translocated molybdopterin oxidoreductase [Acidobacteriota bacterium]|nr:TAT-variant-translocated molybdopterin oxidoreductase [Acidobacteriota bacterium]
MSDRGPSLPVLSPSAAGGPAPVDFAGLRDRLATERGAGYWRSLEELARTPEFAAAMRDVDNGSNLSEGFDRRDLFKFMSVSFALAGLTACTRQPAEKIVPYVRQPEEVVPGGKPLFFATSMTVSGFATGLLVESHLGRPTKAEGNPLHPASLGATDLFGQACLYDLYDPDRSQTLQYLDEIRPWAAFLGAARQIADEERATGGAGLRILTETVGSPTLAGQLSGLLRDFPDARWIQWEPAGRDNVREGARLAFGEHADVVPDLANADVVLSIGSDFLSSGPGSLALTRQFSKRRRPEREHGPMNRLYAIETASTVTGANADHRLAVPASGIEALARRIAESVGAGAGSGGAGPASPQYDEFAAAVAADLKSHTGRCVVLVGAEQPPAVHAIGHAMNSALGNFGHTIRAIEPVEANPSNELAALSELARDMGAGRVSTLLILGGNPVFTAPADLEFGSRLSGVKRRIHLSPYVDETSDACQWHIPQTHFLEAWSDARAFDGTASIVQPLVSPLYEGRSAHEVLAALTGALEGSGYEIVRNHWRGNMPGDFEAAWRRALHDGVIAGTASPEKAVRPRPVPPAGAAPAGAAGTPSGMELVFRPDSRLLDGRFANNGWLQELPDPITRLTWDNAALFSIETAKRLGIEKEDVVELSLDGRALKAAAWVEPGIPDGTVVLNLGHGRTRAGRLGSGTGSNAYALRRSDALWSARGLVVTKTSAKHPLACTQLHQNMEGREIVRVATLDEYEKNPGFVHEREKEPDPSLSLYPAYPSDTYAWGMAIDLSACVGCNACVVACQSENNIPVVGKDQVRRGREMHWLRIDHYYGGEPARPTHFFEPVPCMHCENAPCELVCPVGATVHSAEGLNDMVYNRCVGTRYCSNNCPYKVRRFNFYHYSTQFRAPSMRMLANPDVTVRWRGVMEKCTYCVQRINGAKIDSEIANRRVSDGEITTACAQACPAEAIVFGDLADKESRVSRLRENPRNYGLLSELGTRPRTTYLGSVRNLNPALAKTVPTDFPHTELDTETGQK